jgi:hypothetical protein
MTMLSITNPYYMCINNRVFINPVLFEKTPVSPRLKYLKIYATVLIYWLILAYMQSLLFIRCTFNPTLGKPK